MCRLFSRYVVGVVYICTEDKFPTNRLNQMLRYFPRNSKLNLPMKSFSDRIFVDHIADVVSISFTHYNRFNFSLQL